MFSPEAALSFVCAALVFFVHQMSLHSELILVIAVLEFLDSCIPTNVINIKLFFEVKMLETNIWVTK